MHKKSVPPNLDTSIWSSPVKFSDGVSEAVLYVHDDAPVLVLPRTGSFFIFRDRVEGYLEAGAYPVPYLLGRVFALWLEYNGICVLHGSCLTANGHTFGLLAHSGVGKSTLSTALLRESALLLTDDLIPIPPDCFPPLIHPGIPQSRMWPDTARYFFPDFSRYEKVHPRFEKRKIPAVINGASRFFETTQPLNRLYVLSREPNTTEARIERLNPTQALMELLCYSYRLSVPNALGLQPRRLNVLSKVVQTTPIFKLSYPSGFEYLPQVCLNIRQFHEATV